MPCVFFSINHKAVKYLNQNRDLLPTIGWIIQGVCRLVVHIPLQYTPTGPSCIDTAFITAVEDCSQIRLNSLRLTTVH